MRDTLSNSSLIARSDSASLPFSAMSFTRLTSCSARGPGGTPTRDRGRGGGAPLLRAGPAWLFGWSVRSTSGISFDCLLDQPRVASPGQCPRGSLPSWQGVGKMAMAAVRQDRPFLGLDVCGRSTVDAVAELLRQAGQLGVRAALEDLVPSHLEPRLRSGDSIHPAARRSRLR